MILVDGQEAGILPTDDRGLAYGDGAFETMRVTAGRAPWFERHLARLETTCAALGIALPDHDVLRGEVVRVAAGIERGVAKLIVTRGSGERGYAVTGRESTRRVISAHPLAHPATRWHDGIRVRWCATRLPTSAPLPGAKHLNRLPQVMARREWTDPAITEGLLLDADGAVVEGTMSNLFLVEGASLVTPVIDGAGVAGVARAWILERAVSWGLVAQVRRIEPAEVIAADEVFVCNATVGAWPVVDLDGVRFGIGATTRRVQDALAVEGIGP